MADEFCWRSECRLPHGCYYPSACTDGHRATAPEPREHEGRLRESIGRLEAREPGWVNPRHAHPHATFGDDPSGWCGCADCDPRPDCSCPSCREAREPQPDAEVAEREARAAADALAAVRRELDYADDHGAKDEDGEAWVLVPVIRAAMDCARRIREGGA